MGAGNIDAIYSFASGSDKAVLFQRIFTGLGSGGLAASAFVPAARRWMPTNRIIYKTATATAPRSSSPP